jgi:hypothetical protein
MEKTDTTEMVKGQSKKYRVATKFGVTFLHFAKRCRCFHKKFKHEKNKWQQFCAIVTIFKQ